MLRRYALAWLAQDRAWGNHGTPPGYGLVWLGRLLIGNRLVFCLVVARLKRGCGQAEKQGGKHGM